MTCKEDTGTHQQVDVDSVSNHNYKAMSLTRHLFMSYINSLAWKVQIESMTLSDHVLLVKEGKHLPFHFAHITLQDNALSQSNTYSKIKS